MNTMRSKIREALERGFVKLDDLARAKPGRSAEDKRAGRPLSRPSLKRHARKCTVCRHPERAQIEEDFLRWRSPEVIAREHAIADHSSIYRHAHATGLYDRRIRNVRVALDPLIEQACTVPVTAKHVIKAVEVFAHMDRRGKWISSGANRQSPRLKHHAKH
jgi:hypothetical protein